MYVHISRTTQRICPHIQSSRLCTYVCAFFMKSLSDGVYMYMFSCEKTFRSSYVILNAVKDKRLFHIYLKSVWKQRVVVGFGDCLHNILSHAGLTFLDVSSLYAFSCNQNTCLHSSNHYIHMSDDADGNS